MSTPAPTGSIPAPNTTLAVETGNNTSAADSFTRQTNGNAGAGNVSKIPIGSLLYPGSTTKIFATWLAWFGQPNHIDVGYNSDTQAEVHAQVQDMISRGLAGAIPDWYGPARTNMDDATMMLKREAEASGGKFEFAIEEDRGSLADAARANGCDVTDQLISDLTYIANNYESSPAYHRINGRPVVYFFDVNLYYVDWNRVIASVPGNPLIILRGNQGFTSPAADGGFSWVNIQQDDPFNNEMNLQDTFFQQAQSSGKIPIGTAFKGFNDTLASWGTDRVIDQACGQTWVQSLNEIGKFYSSSNQLPAIQIATWNDYEEGTEIETGIDNCVYLVPSQSGNTISWTVNGNEDTIDHYTVFISTDGTNLSSLTDVPRGTHSVDLSKLSLSPSKTYSIYVKAIGLPSIRNTMAPPIGFRQGDTPPTASLNVSQGDGLTFIASTSGSSGNISTSTIDFGDGTVAKGPTASHTYNAVGVYLITATVADSNGASSVAVQQVSVKQPGSGVTISAPNNSASVNWPTPIVASGNAGQVAAMQILVDGKVAYAAHTDALNTAIKVNTGNHQITVQSLDASGNPTGSASLNVTAEPTDVPPVAKIVLTAEPSVSPTSVLACSVESTDADGFVNSHKMQFSNGDKVNAAGALETFAAPGGYTVTATVVDQYGATDSTTTSFNVGNGTISGVSSSQAPQQGLRKEQEVSNPIGRDQ